MFADLYLADYFGTEPIGLAVITIVFAVIGITVWRRRKKSLSNPSNV